ncbi:3-methyladenine DNA glycosylase [Candidatus Marinarcus aquaticus]|uniref:3-methyladenine DNA glycosylase n=1 Tax=Candidatus Marinarcus aquaticus TaxID=2044504 RepID=A0A4V1LNX4_9BACT|nr:3-methyladenine DNA glycosylase [Candidatus Marinarcus aquaticus]RXJ57530.1 3-methyladenine DNA glycosylase [Candidatus Marinarcus aquaticus]
MNNSFELLIFLKQKELLKDAPKYWWPSHGGFETLIGAILTQNTKWTNVEKSIANLMQLNLLHLEAMAQSDIGVLTYAITPSGFKNQKSKRLKQLCNNILETFETFEQFQEEVSREWLLSQKGIGLETADAILCYCCCREEMVVDKYTQRLVETFGYTFESYEELKAWCEYGINENFDKIVQLYGYNITLNELYCRFHGKIVEFMKINPRV